MKGKDCIHFIACARMNAHYGYTDGIDNLCVRELCPLYVPKDFVLKATLSNLILEAQIRYDRGVFSQESEPEPEPEPEGVPFTLERGETDGRKDAES